MLSTMVMTTFMSNCAQTARLAPNLARCSVATFHVCNASLRTHRLNTPVARRQARLWHNSVRRGAHLATPHSYENVSKLVSNHIRFHHFFKFSLAVWSCSFSVGLVKFHQNYTPDV